MKLSLKNKLALKMDTPSIIKHYRGSQSLRYFAQQLDVSHAAVSKWEQGTAEPTTERINAFVTDSRPWVAEMGKTLFLARNGQTLRTLIK